MLVVIIAVTVNSCCWLDVEGKGEVRNDYEVSGPHDLLDATKIRNNRKSRFETGEN